MRIDLRSRVATPGHVLAREIGDELVLLNLDSENYFALDQVGAQIWNALAEHGFLQPVFDELLADYEVDRPRLRRDLIGLTEELIRHGLLSIRAA